MDTLRRDAAPLSDRVWKEIDEAVSQAARHVLTARRVATFDGPHGWDQLVASRLGAKPIQPAACKRCNVSCQRSRISRQRGT